MNMNGEVHAIDNSERDSIKAIIERKASAGLRTIGLAYKNIVPGKADDAEVCQDV